MYRELRPVRSPARPSDGFGNHFPARVGVQSSSTKPSRVDELDRGPTRSAGGSQRWSDTVGIPRLGIGEHVRAGPLWMGDLLGIVPLGGSNHPPVMPAGTLERIGELQPTVRALVKDPAESPGWSPNNRSTLSLRTMESLRVCFPCRNALILHLNLRSRE